MHYLFLDTTPPFMGKSKNKLHGDYRRRQGTWTCEASRKVGIARDEAI